MASDRQLQLALRYSHCNPKPSALLNSIFMSTVNTAAKTLVSVASASKSDLQVEKWKPVDHLRFMVMMMSWLTVWALRILMDHFPFSSGINYPSPTTSSMAAAALSPYVFNHGRGMSNNVGSFHQLLASSSSSVLSSAMCVFSSSSSACSDDHSMDLVLHEGPDVASAKSLGRALTNVFAVLNEMPASSRKYQFAVAMADRIVDENLRGGHVELLQINRRALASAFARTSELLHRSMQSATSQVEDPGPWVARVVKALPLGSYVSFFMKGLGTVFPSLGPATSLFYRQKQPAIPGLERLNDLAAEKHAQELLWITNKMRGSGTVDEAWVHWSWASGLASSALTANPRVQSLIVKITAILLGELRRAKVEDEEGEQVKYRILALWVPLFCYADTGLSFPLMSGYERAEMERIIGDLISSLPPLDQEVILTNWLQDFTNSSSDWPNLQAAYDKWCNSTRNLLL